MKVAAVIPAFNEEKNVTEVLDVVKSAPELNEIILVNDGSSDQTSRVAKVQGIRVIDLESNLGKGAAVLAGVKATDADYILLLDADLVGLCPHHIKELLEPVLKGRTEMTLGVFKSGRTMTNLSQKITPFLNGQRVVKREILMDLSDLDFTRYGFDLTLSRYAKKIGVEVVEVELDQITQVMKEEKLGLLQGIVARLKMYWEVLVSLGVKLPPHS